MQQRQCERALGGRVRMSSVGSGLWGALLVPKTWPWGEFGREMLACSVS